MAMQYFKQEKPEAGLGYDNSAIGAINNANDPYYQTDVVPCSKSFVLLLTDGASTKDSKIPAALKETDGDGDNLLCNESTGTNCDYSSGGTDYLDDVALYARTNDLRADLAGEQNLILYPIYAFGEDNNARNLLRDAAKNGGFNDKNGNGLPDGNYIDPPAARLEWDAKATATRTTISRRRTAICLRRGCWKPSTIFCSGRHPVRLFRFLPPHRKVRVISCRHISGELSPLWPAGNQTGWAICSLCG